ncbi:MULTISPECIES: hypothetical protein [unclassified Streptomyces]|uniref:hypothetical protein n=1 Tax=unclassified Streptomyces TaxID=2593676 RepID=UPI002E2E4268|nr:hypothetical protein [Streptomyces sp. NBC_00223]
MTTTPERAPEHAQDGEAADDGTAQLPPARDLPRWVRWTVVPLLVLVPIGYVIISAEQSRGDGDDEAAQAQTSPGHRIADFYPTKLQRRIYQVPIPPMAHHVRSMETNSWETSELYVEFTTTPGGLDTFLAQVGTSRAELRDGQVAMSAAQCALAGWDFSIPRQWGGATLHQAGDKPDHDITVSLSDPDWPRVYVVSTVNFQHGFSGG